MFTGIIETTGTLRACDTHGALGDSIAVNGVCLTATALGADWFSADVSAETLRLTTLGDLSPGAAVNLERALTLATPLGGHLVSGHVDGVGELIDRIPEARSERLTIAAPRALMRYIAAKGSITVDGISLTVNGVDGDTFHVNIVPHTQARTTLADLRPGARVNLEVDLIARYLERLLQAPQESGLTLDTLRQHGY